MQNPAEELAEVSLAQFAAICGMSERQYVEQMLACLSSGCVMDLLTASAQVDICQWMLAGDLYRKRSNFLVMFRLSLNRADDVCLYVACKFLEDGAIEVYQTIPGLCGRRPKEVEGLPTFEVAFCDMAAPKVE
jgi:hypothetical protein